MSIDQNSILIIVNMLISALSPLIVSLSYMMRHIETSSCTTCFGNGLKLKQREDSELQLKKMSIKDEVKINIEKLNK